MAYTNSSGGGGRGERENEKGYCHMDGKVTMEIMW